MERFRTLFADDPEVAIPRAYRELSTGARAHDGASRGLSAAGHHGARGRPGAQGLDRGVKLFRLLWRQMLEFGVLHADPHPGNYLVTHHPTLGILDFGSVRVFEPADAPGLSAAGARPHGRRRRRDRRGVPGARLRRSGSGPRAVRRPCCTSSASRSWSTAPFDPNAVRHRGARHADRADHDRRTGSTGPRDTRCFCSARSSGSTATLEGLRHRSQLASHLRGRSCRPCPTTRGPHEAFVRACPPSAAIAPASSPTSPS